MTLKSLSIICLTLLFADSVEGQGILNRVLKRSVQKAENKVEDMLVEKASEAIAQRIYKSMSDAFDQMLDDASKQDSTYQADYSDSVAIKYGQLSGDWMARMNEAADVPESYSFDHKVHVQITSDGDPQSSILYLKSEGTVFAMEQLEKTEKRICLIDGSKDVVILYLEDSKGKKTAQAIPNMMGIGAAIVNSSVDTLVNNWSFKATGKTKQVAGYDSKEFESTDGEYESRFYITDQLDISWKSSFSGLVDRFAGTQYGNFDDLPNGFMLESHTNKVGKSKDESSWITEKVVKEPFAIVNAESLPLS
ncbi:MAG: hypothetical protein IPL46_31785 [Saprospiraceae bacterium]|nr:hypothetical protein [Saprospiraceae bacterium]